MILHIFDAMGENEFNVMAPGLDCLEGKFITVDPISSILNMHVTILYFISSECTLSNGSFSVIWDMYLVTST